MSTPPSPDPDDPRTITVDRTGVITHWGRDLERVSGYTPAEVIGQKVDLVIPPEFRSMHWRGFRRAIESGRKRLPNITFRFPAIAKDGAVVALRATLGLTHAEDGTVDGAVGTFAGQGPAWERGAWRVVLGALRAVGAVTRRTPGR